MKHAAAPIAILGSYPPPWGGTSNHVQRLSALLDGRGVDHVIYNAVSDGTDGRRVVSVARHRTQWMLRYAVSSAEQLAYVCSDRLEIWVLCALMVIRRKKRVLVRLRNAALRDYLKKPTTRAVASWALRHVSVVVAVSRELEDAAREAGVAPERIVYQPGFLPPSAPPPGTDGLSSSQRGFLASHRRVIAANGKVGWYDGIDLYGLDHMVEMMGRLKPRYPDLGLAIAFWDHLPEDEPRLSALRRRAEELGVAGDVLFHTASGPFVPLLARSEIFVRPTVTDGDANSVREALYLGVPAVASDVVARPEGTVLVKTRDLESLIATVERLLQHPPPRTKHPEVVDMDRVERYLDLLENLATAS